MLSWSFWISEFNRLLENRNRRLRKPHKRNIFENNYNNLTELTIWILLPSWIPDFNFGFSNCILFPFESTIMKFYKYLTIVQNCYFWILVVLNLDMFDFRIRLGALRNIRYEISRKVFGATTCMEFRISILLFNFRECNRPEISLQNVTKDPV